MARFQLAAEHRKTAAGILVSFHAKWSEKINAGQISVVFRKRLPLVSSPTVMFAYIGSPKSEINARLPIESIEELSIAECFALSDRGAITQREIERYADGRTHLRVARVGAPLVALSPVTLDLLQTRFDFFPTPNFISLSDEGVQALSALGNFERPREKGLVKD